MPSVNRQKTALWNSVPGVLAFALALSFSGLSCAQSPDIATNSGDAGQAESAEGAAVLARVGDSEILQSEVEALVTAQLVQARNQRYQALEQGLSQAVSDRLLELEAAARGITTEELLAAEVEGKIGEVPQEQIDAFYEERQAQIRAPKEQVEEQIRQYLRQQQGGPLFRTLVADLEAKYGVERYLEPPRVAVSADGHPAKGPAGAPVTIVEFSDFECPFCSRVLPSLRQVMENYGDSVRVVFRQFPLNNIHPRAQKAAEASLCAHDQGKFWEMHDAMFDEQKNLGVDQLKEKAGRIGLDAESFASCLDGDKFAPQVAADLEEGSAAGVSGTPAMFINGRFVNGAVPYETLAEIIDRELERAGAS
ncbi:MAG: thioredoxin domain-containing protein [Acidobacteriota bacterium]|nr:thioredoxin domain-containing protein [Acidobacteriota bacterium]